MTVWVVDTPPLVFLARLDRLSLLRDDERTLCAPQAVYDEVCARDDDAFDAITQAVGDWLAVREVTDRTAVDLIRADLGAGEAEAIVLATELEAERLVVDDLEARRFASRVGLSLVGTVGLLLAAKLRGDIPSLRTELDHLDAAGFRMSAALAAAVISRAGE